MNKKTHELSRAEKILLFLYEFGKGKKVRIRYEDIVAGVFKRFPGDFHLKGYPQYPDSGDLIHKPLYDFKKKGYVNAENKVFSLTEYGVEFAEQLSKQGKSGSINSNGRLSRSTEIEFSRIKNLEGFGLFVKGNMNSISDTDFYTYLGTTVRTQKNAFVGRLNTMETMIKELKNQIDDPVITKVIHYHEFMMERYENIVGFFKDK